MTIHEAVEYLEQRISWASLKGDYDIFIQGRRADDLLSLLKSLDEKQKAEWIEYPECLKYKNALDDTYIACSSCGHVFNMIDNCTEEFDYCPHCGAKME